MAWADLRMLWWVFIFFLARSNSRTTANFQPMKTFLFTISFCSFCLRELNKREQWNFLCKERKPLSQQMDYEIRSARVERVEMRFYIRKLCWTGEKEVILNRITEKASERTRRDKLCNKVSPQPLPLTFKLITNDSPIIVQRADENNIKWRKIRLANAQFFQLFPLWRKAIFMKIPFSTIIVTLALGLVENWCGKKTRGEVKAHEGIFGIPLSLWMAWDDAVWEIEITFILNS